MLLFLCQFAFLDGQGWDSGWQFKLERKKRIDCEKR
jgi:hypothetical protein